MTEERLAAIEQRLQDVEQRLASVAIQLDNLAGKLDVLIEQLAEEESEPEQRTLDGGLVPGQDPAHRPHPLDTL